MKTMMIAAALLLSILSLAFQVAKRKPAPIFEKYLVPASVSDFDYRVMRAQESMTREAIAMRDGIGVPFIRELGADHQRIIVRVFVSEKDLPKTYDERKKALLMTGFGAAASVLSEFDFKLDPEDYHAVTVEFMSIEQLVKDSAKGKPYAEFANGELTFH